MSDGSEEAERVGLKLHRLEKRSDMTDEPKQELIALLKVQQIVESLESLPASLANHLALFELKREELRVAEEDLKLAQVNAEVAAWAQENIPPFLAKRDASGRGYDGHNLYIPIGNPDAPIQEREE